MNYFREHLESTESTSPVLGTVCPRLQLIKHDIFHVSGYCELNMNVSVSCRNCCLKAHSGPKDRLSGFHGACIDRNTLCRAMAPNTSQCSMDPVQQMLIPHLYNVHIRSVRSPLYGVSGTKDHSIWSVIISVHGPQWEKT